eukprot:m51a1_g607 putative rna polymerase ii (126) ;mRNA; r:87506-88104
MAAEDISAHQFKPMECLSISEVLIILDKRKREDINGEMTNVFNATYDYADTFAVFKTPNIIAAARKHLAESVDVKFKEFEMSLLINLCPVDAEEAHALIPTLKRFDAGVLTPVLKELNDLRRSGQ